MTAGAVHTCGMDDRVLARYVRGLQHEVSELVAETSRLREEESTRDYADSLIALLRRWAGAHPDSPLREETEEAVAGEWPA